MAIFTVGRSLLGAGPTYDVLGYYATGEISLAITDDLAYIKHQLESYTPYPAQSTLYQQENPWPFYAAEFAGYDFSETDPTAPIYRIFMVGGDVTVEDSATNAYKLFDSAIGIFDRDFYHHDVSDLKVIELGEEEYVLALVVEGSKAFDNGRSD